MAQKALHAQYECEMCARVAVEGQCFGNAWRRWHVCSTLNFHRNGIKSFYYREYDMLICDEHRDPVQEIRLMEEDHWKEAVGKGFCDPVIEVHVSTSIRRENGSSVPRPGVMPLPE